MQQLNRRWLPVFALILAIAVLVLEFFVDINTDTLWRPVVVSIDLTLVAGFALYVAKSAFTGRRSLLAWLLHEKINLMVLITILACLPVPRIAAGILICRLLVGGVAEVFDTKLGKRFVAQINLKPSQTLALSFIAAILVGSLLLTFPAATTDGKGAGFWDSVFTMTSAICVTGLAVVDIGTYFSRFGQTIILLAIQVGGLGIMVMSAVFAVLVGGHLPSRHQVGLSEILDVRTSAGVKSLLQAVAGATFVFEFLGTMFLFVAWHHDIPNFGDRLWWSVFHAVSAFCNCGYSLSSNSFEPWVANPFVCAVMMSLILTGGLGFSVIADLVRPQVWVIKHPRAIWERLHTQTKVVLVGTVTLNLLGALLFLFMEYNGALKGLSIGTKLNASIFQAVTLRSAGFNSVSYAQLTIPTILYCILWMFIGAAPGSTGGGIKITTATIALHSVKTMLRGRAEVEVLNRRIPPITVARSLSIVLISAMVVLLFLMLLSGVEGFAFEQLLFEVVSAFGTVGVSMGITPKLDNLGRFLVIVLMYIGRIGPLTLALAIGEKYTSKGYRLPVGKIAVG